MGCRHSMTVFALVAGLFLSPTASLAQSGTSSAKRVLADGASAFNVSAVEALLKKGDAAASRGNLQEARKFYDKARKASKQLLSFYRDLGGSFRGLDARIPREMDSKGRKALVLLSKTNLRLAALFRRQNQPEVAVPILVEVVRLMTPAKSEGKKAYQGLLELGFVETPYAAAKGSY